MDNIELLDSSEFHKPELKPKEESKPKTSFDFFANFGKARYPIYAVVWFILLKYAYQYHLGHAYVFVTALIFMLTNLGTRKKGELSAYSVFNKGGKKLMGTLDATQIDPRYRGGRGQQAAGDNNYAGLRDADDGDEDFDDEPELQNTKLNKISKMNNQPCYCGSGKKFKKCCYWRELKQRQIPKAQ